MSRRFVLVRSVPIFVLALPAALAFLADACTSSEDESPIGGGTVSQAPTPEGWMLSSGHVPGQGLFATRLPGGKPRPMALSNDTVVFDARWSEPGESAYAFVQHGTDQTEVQLVKVGTTGEAAPVGDALENVNSTSAAGGTYLAATCFHGDGDTQVVADGDEAWRHVADACTATLSPEGTKVAFSEDGHTISTVPVEGGEPAVLFDLDDVAALKAAGLREPHIQEIAWGDAGLAMVLQRGEHFGLLIHTDDADHVSAIAGSPAFVGGLKWQPKGSLVAVVTFFQGQGGLLRAMDARTGQVRVLATDPRGLGGTVWAPDGSLLASLGSRGAWVFVDEDGHRATEVPVDNEIPFDWGM
jgi:hypothetical protein